MTEFLRQWDQIEDDLGFNDCNMQRSRPYNGQIHTSTGERGRQEISGVTMRDLRDCYIRAVLMACNHLIPEALYNEALKGEEAAICENDLYGFNLDGADPIAIWQNMACEIEKIMGIFPNVPQIQEGEQR